MHACTVVCVYRYISHYGSGTASLNVTVAGSIVLHHFGLWARFAERPRLGEKYVVDPVTAAAAAATAAANDGVEPVLSELDLQVRQERAAERRLADAEAAAALDEPIVLVIPDGAATVAGGGGGGGGDGGGGALDDRW